MGHTLKVNKGHNEMDKECEINKLSLFRAVF